VKGRYFSERELGCPCGCGQNGVTEQLVTALDDLRELAGEPIHINDAFRCKHHNEEVGGVPNSEHPNGQAADIRIQGKTPIEMYELAQQIPAFNEGGIGLYDHGNFIHVDVREKRARWARVNGKYCGIDVLLKRWSSERTA
jgi:uncharacterized protein YcbK (DUF882 family)